MSEAIVTNGRVEDFRSDLSSLARRRLPAICVIAVAILAITPAIFRGIPSNFDLWNHFRFALPFYDSLQSGHAAPGWLAESNAGFGDPSFRFYPPATYYLLAACRFFTGNWYAASLLLFTLLSVIGGLGVYFWARAFLPRQLAMWAGIFFTLMPYHVNELYQAFLLAEYAGCAVLPFAFAFVERICQRRRMRDVAGLAASFAILVLTHLPLTIIGSIALLFYGLLRMEKGLRWATLQRLALGVLLGLAASAFYWVTMLAEVGWIRADTTRSDHLVDYRFNFLFSTFSPDNMNVWWVNILTIASLVMLLPCIALVRRRARLRGLLRSRGVLVTCALLLFSLFMTTPLSGPIWMLLPPLQQAQFPWRWLALFSMAGSVAAAATIHFWIKRARGRTRPFALLVAGGVLVSITLTFSQIVNEARYLSPKQFNETLSIIPGSPSIDYWLTVWAVEPLRGMTERVEAGERGVKISSWDAESREFEVSAGEATEARVRTFYYPQSNSNSWNPRESISPQA
ncbi:MAG: 6-pyruvoyl-tetrahydropterin synthase-related protein [Acidobacteriota bacterium]|nr:6-pyruvoyl-tetrahydropterin synthase-related protein [Acidobacteriota bacterium]